MADLGLGGGVFLLIIRPLAPPAPKVQRRRGRIARSARGSPAQGTLRTQADSLCARNRCLEHAGEDEAPPHSITDGYPAVSTAVVRRDEDTVGRRAVGSACLAVDAG